MSRRPAPGALVAGALAVIGLGAPLAIGRTAAASPIVVGLIGPPEDRLTEEVGRELAIARFAIVRVDLRVDPRVDPRVGPAAVAGGAAGAVADELAAVPADLLLGVLVAPDDRRLVVFARQASLAGLHTRIEIQVDPRDHLARRRACIAVVEYLRVLAEGTRLPSVTAVEPVAPEARAPPRPAPPSNALAVTPPAPRLPVSAPAVGHALPLGPPPPVMATHAPAAIATRPERAAVPPVQRRWWAMGIATALDLSGAVSGATAHLQFIWRTRLGSHLAIRARGLWPLLGSGVTTDGRDVRMWTFGVAADAQYSFVDPGAIVRPFLGVTGGAGLIVTDTGVLAAPESGSSTTPTVALGLQAGLAYRVSSVVELFVEVEANRDWLIPGVKRSGYQATIANATSLHSSIGALFDY